MKNAVDPMATPTDTNSVKARQQVMWASGDFAVIGTTLQIVGELVCEGLTFARRAGARRRRRQRQCDAGGGAPVWPCHVDRLRAGAPRTRRQRAAAESLEVSFEVADAEALPYPDASFDVVLSTFGVMFAPDHQQAASELRR